MKKTVATFCLLGATLGLSACNSATTGHVDTAPPYAMDRTASYGSEKVAPVAATPTRVAPAEKVFRRAQTK
jgi:hypothetical protein